MIVWPDWADPLGIPGIGDTVRTGYELIVRASAVRPPSFQVSVQPRTPPDVLSEQGRAIGALLQSSHDQTGKFIDRYLRTDIKPAEADGLRVQLKTLLENYRSALEYTAHHIADYCNPKPPPDRVQFPVANSNDTAADFEKNLDKWFPGLGTSKPKVRAHLLSIQDFKDESWLRQLADLTNFNKHRSLSQQELGEFHSVLVTFGGAGLRFGELGYLSMTLDATGILRFVNSAGGHADLVGPCVLDINTQSLPGADPRIELLQEKRQMYRIPGQKESIVGLLWKIDRNVLCTVNCICNLLS